MSEQALNTPLRLNIGCGRDIRPGWVNVDSARLPGVDIVQDLETLRDTPLPIADNSVDEFLLCHVIEHIRDPLGMMQELYRVAKPDAKLVAQCPYGSSDDAWEDPTHVRAYFIGSWGFFSQPFYWRADYGYRGDWQPMKIDLLMHAKDDEGLSAEALMARLQRERNIVRECVVTMTAIKPHRAAKRELQTPPKLQLHWSP